MLFFKLDKLFKPAYPGCLKFVTVVAFKKSAYLFVQVGKAKEVHFRHLVINALVHQFNCPFDQRFVLLMEIVP